MKKRVIFNVILILIIGFLGYTLYSSISEPINFMDERDRRESAVVVKLVEIRKAQEAYRGVTGHFAPNFDTLVQVLRTGQFMMIRVEGDPDDPNNLDKVIYDTSYVPAIDSINSLGINLDSLKYVPFTNGEVFSIDADTLRYQQTLVDVVEVGIERTKFMGKWGESRFKKYDDNYDPSIPIKFGDMNKPSLAGNWER